MMDDHGDGVGVGEDGLEDGVQESGA